MQKEKDTRRLIKECEKKSKDAREGILDIFNEIEGNLVAQKSVQAVVMGFADLNGADVRVTLVNIDLEGLTLKKKRGESIEETTVSLKFVMDSSHIATVNQTVKVPKTVSKGIDIIETCTEDRADLSKRALELRLALGNMDVLERQARAKLATFALENSHGGEDLINAISNMNTQFLLPE